MMKIFNSLYPLGFHDWFMLKRNIIAPKCNESRPLYRLHQIQNLKLITR